MTDQSPKMLKASPADSGMGETLEFMRRLWALDNALQSLSKRMQNQMGVNSPQRLVIRLVAKYPDISAGELATILQVHPSTLTGVFRRLENDQLIHRAEDPEDGRRVVFRLTRQGEVLNGLRAGTVEGALRRAMARIPTERLETTKEVLEALTSELAETSSQPKQLSRGLLARYGRHLQS